MYMCNIQMLHMYIQMCPLLRKIWEERLAGRFATESAEPYSSSESTLIWTKAEAPKKRGSVWRRHSTIQVGDPCNLSLKDTTTMALPAPECTWEFGSGGALQIST